MFSTRPQLCTFLYKYPSIPHPPKLLQLCHLPLIDSRTKLLPAGHLINSASLLLATTNYPSRKVKHGLRLLTSSGHRHHFHHSHLVNTTFSASETLLAGQHLAHVG